MTIIPENARNSPAVAAALEKGYSQLIDVDIVALVNARLDHVRSSHESFNTRISVEEGNTTHAYPCSNNELKKHPQITAVRASKRRTSRSRHPPTRHHQTAANAVVMCSIGMVCVCIFHTVSTERLYVQFATLDARANHFSFLAQDAEVIMWRWSALASTDATALPPSASPSQAFPTVTVLDSPPPKAKMSVWNAHAAEVRRLLSANRVVIIRNAEQHAPSYDWDAESLCGIFKSSPDGARMQWQCKSSSA